MKKWVTPWSAVENQLEHRCVSPGVLARLLSIGKLDLVYSHPVPGGYRPKCVGEACAVPRHRVIPLKPIETSRCIVSITAINPLISETWCPRSGVCYAISYANGEDLFKLSPAQGVAGIRLMCAAV